MAHDRNASHTRVLSMRFIAASRGIGQRLHSRSTAESKSKNKIVAQNILRKGHIYHMRTRRPLSPFLLLWKCLLGPRRQGKNASTVLGAQMSFSEDPVMRINYRGSMKIVVQWNGIEHNLPHLADAQRRLPRSLRSTEGLSSLVSV